MNEPLTKSADSYLLQTLGVLALLFVMCVCSFSGSLRALQGLAASVPDCAISSLRFSISYFDVPKRCNFAIWTRFFCFALVGPLLRVLDSVACRLRGLLRSFWVVDRF